VGAVRKRLATVAAVGWLVACGHGTPGAGGRGEREPADAGAAGVALRDAGASADDAQVTVVDAGPVFPAKFSRNRDYPPCDPRKPDRKNPNCCWGYDLCSRTPCYVPVTGVIGEGRSIIELGVGWNDGIIRGQSVWWEGGEPLIVEEFSVGRVFADVAYASCERNSNVHDRMCKHFDEIVAAGEMRIRRACWDGPRPEREFQKARTDE
jgi:hypothetical protein